MTKEIICSNCNGSGEGMHDGTRCYECHGTGTQLIDSEDTDQFNNDDFENEDSDDDEM
jgi:DnaJ-class molecular chaperone